MSRSLTAADSIARADPGEKCYEGASARGQLKFKNGGQGWPDFCSKTGTYKSLGAPPTLAMGLTECCAELGRGMVYWFVRADYSLRATYPWTQTTAELPSLLYVDFVWDDATKEEWFKQSHEDRLDRLNARAGALNLNIPTMPLTFIFEVDNYDNVRISEGMAPTTLTYNSSGYTYLGFTADMTSHMQYGGTSRSGYYWQAPKDKLTQFRMMSGPDVVVRLQAMYREVRPETLFFLSAIIDEAIKGHNEWVANGGYTIAGDPDLGPALARKVEAAVQEQRVREAGDAMQEARDEIERGDVTGDEVEKNTDTGAVSET